MTIRVHHPLHLLRLRFPVVFRITVLNGTLYLRNHGASKKLLCGESMAVPAFLRFDCDVMPLKHRAAEFSLEVASVPVDAHQVTEREKEWSRPLAQHIFMSPQGSWTAACVAHQWQVTPQKARARLFAEGEALRSLVREQRVAHALYMAARMDGSDSHDLATIAVRSGFASMTAFSDICEEMTGVPANAFLQ